MTDDTAPTTPPALECIGLQKRFGDVTAVAGLDLVVEPGEILGVLGPSGCGKTTALRLIAGFEQADEGTVRLAGATVVDPSTFVPPERRRVGMVFQDYALFPHLTVAANIAYGTTVPTSLAGRMRGVLGGLGGNRFRNASALSDRVRHVLELVELTHAALRYPHELSGGEAQRVALARALAPEPDLILLDEPFSNLDSSLRSSVRQQVRSAIQHAGASAVFVTHDQEEAFALADRVAVMQRGRIEQTGLAAEIYQHPATRFVATFVGDADFLPGQVDGGLATTELGPVPAHDLPSGAEVDVMVRPESIVLAGAQAAPDVDAPAGTVIGHEYYGHDQMLAVRLTSGREIHVRLGPGATYADGDHVRLALGEGATVFPRELD